MLTFFTLAALVALVALVLLVALASGVATTDFASMLTLASTVAVELAAGAAVFSLGAQPINATTAKERTAKNANTFFINLTCLLNEF